MNKTIKMRFCFIKLKIQIIGQVSKKKEERTTKEERKELLKKFDIAVAKVTDIFLSAETEEERLMIFNVIFEYDEK